MVTHILQIFDTRTQIIHEPLDPEVDVRQPWSVRALGAHGVRVVDAAAAVVGGGAAAGVSAAPVTFVSW